MYFTEDQFTEKTTKLLNRMHLVLIQHIVTKERQLELYKELGDKTLIDLANDEVKELKADLEQLKNL